MASIAFSSAAPFAAAYRRRARAVAYRATTTQVVVRGSVEETLNALLDAEADRLCNAQRYKERN